MSRKSFVFALTCALACGHLLIAQEASSGFDLRSTLSAQGMASNELTQAPRSGDAGTAGFRAMVYPTWKINDNWFVASAVQFVTRPYFYESFDDAGYGAKGYVLQANLNYSRIAKNKSILVRVGQLSSSFGSFLLRYDDADNPLVDLPMQYGYYYASVSTLGVAGGEIDATLHRWDARAQFANSSPANPRSLFQHDQYGNWAGGVGYTIHQGFRVGVSGYRGPYLYRGFPYYFPGEAPPNTLPAHALGADGSWARHHTSIQAEVQNFVMPYRVIPTIHKWASYAEVKQTLDPRWYVAARAGLTDMNRPGSEVRNVESAVGFRPNRFQLIKVDYELAHHDSGTVHDDHVFAVQFVTTVHLSASER